MDQHDIKEIERRLNSYTAYKMRNRIEELFYECYNLCRSCRYENWVDEYSHRAMNAQIDLHRTGEKLDIALKRYKEYIFY